MYLICFAPFVIQYLFIYTCSTISLGGLVYLFVLLIFCHTWCLSQSPALVLFAITSASGAQVLSDACGAFTHKLTATSNGSEKHHGHDANVAKFNS